MSEKFNMSALISKYRTELMGFAGIWILFYHEWRSLLGDSILGKAERFVVEMGFYGVDIFLFLSGMGLVYAIGKRSVAEFYKRRLRKLLVPYVVTLVVCIFVQGWDLPHFLRIFSSWNFWAVDMYTTPWYLYAIVIFYLAFPLYYAGFSCARSKILFTLGVMAVWLLCSNAVSGLLRFDLYGFTNRIPIFITGILAGYWAREKTPLVFTRKHWTLCVLALLAGIVTSFLTRYQGAFILVPSSECFLPDYLITVSGCCLLAQLLSLLDRRCKAVGTGVKKVLSFYGVMSLELYCMQYILLKKFQILLVGRLPDAAINLVNFAAITLLTLGLYRLCQAVSKKLGLQ